MLLNTGIRYSSAVFMFPRASGVEVIMRPDSRPITCKSESVRVLLIVDIASSVYVLFVTY